MDLVNLINESNAESGKGSAAGRGKLNTGKKKGHSKSAKSRVKVYKSITDALSKGYLGQIFSTTDADRLYVITKRTHGGTDGEQEVGGRVAKGFSPGNIPSDFTDVKKYSVRTMMRHGKQSGDKFKGKKYWSREKK
tara:strand:+ start:10849 stop:11256 length:408 start_codon:yes stop_codon:yes gene_type:complete